MVTFTIPMGTMAGSYPYTVTGNTALPDNVIHTVAGTLTVLEPPPPDMAHRPPDMAQPMMNNGGGNGGSGGGGNGGSGGGGNGGNGGGVGGNGQNNGNNGNGMSSGCSMSGNAATSGAWIFGLLCVVALVARRRKA
jgi:MYXO-CTERM domain-containing protein